MPSGSGCSARRSNPPTTPSSRRRSTAPSPAGTRRRSGCSDTARRKPSGENITLLVPEDRLPEMQDALRRIGWGESIEHNETVRLRKDGQPDRSLAQHLPDQVPLRRDHRHLEGGARHHRNQQDQAGAAAADRRASPHLRDLAGSDHGDGCQRISGSDQPELRGHIGLPAGGNDRPQRRGLHSSRPSREIPRGNARGAARAAPEDFRYALHSQERAGGVAVMARNMVRAGQALLLRRPRHDREPAGAGDAARKRTTGARHHRHGARRLRPDRRAGLHPGLECAGRKYLRLVAR